MFTINDALTVIKEFKKTISNDLEYGGFSDIPFGDSHARAALKTLRLLEEYFEKLNKTPIPLGNWNDIKKNIL